MPDYRTKSALIIDNGSFLELAVKLSESFGRVSYFSSWVSAFPTSNAVLIGTGIPGVERVDDFWQRLSEVDLVVVPDLYYPGLQTHLDDLKIPCWGSRWGEELELDRVASKKRMKKLGIEVGDYVVIQGMPALREYLKTNTEKWVKIPKTRGDAETFFAENYKLIESRLDDLEHFLGAGKLTKEFLIEDDIPDSLDIAADIYCVDGEFPKVGQISHEVKDRACVGRVLPASKWPKQVIDTNEKIAEDLRLFGYRNFLAMETRVTKDGKGYVNDPCCRLSAPPGGLLLNQYTNLDEIIYEGATNGRCIDPIPAGKWGVSLVIYSEWAEKNWQGISFPAKLRDKIKLKNFARIKRNYYVVPQATGLCEIGEVAGIGDTLEEAIADAKETGEQIKGYKVKVFTETLDTAQEEIEKMTEYGITL